MCLQVSYKKKMWKEKKIILPSLKSLKKGVGSGSVSQEYGSADPDPHQNVMDPQHGLLVSVPVPYLVAGTCYTVK